MRRAKVSDLQRVQPPPGMGVLAGYLLAQPGRQNLLWPLLLASVPAFVFGLAEDLTKKVSVRTRLRVAVFSTGDEVVSPGSARSPSQLFDSNRFMLVAMLARLGCEVSDLGILGDDRLCSGTGPSPGRNDRGTVFRIRVRHGRGGCRGPRLAG